MYNQVKSDPKSVLSSSIAAFDVDEACNIAKELLLVVLRLGPDGN